MKRAWIARPCLAAVVALYAATATTALAAPVIVNASGEPPVKTGFTGTSKESTLETKSGESVKCKEDKVTGKITGSSSDEAEVKFTGCSAVGGLLKCKTKGAASGEIVLKMTGTLVWIDEAKQEPGEDLVLPETLTIECTGLASETLHVKGSIICPTTTELSTTATLTCNETKGIQEPSEYEEGGGKFKDITETEGTGTKKFSFEQSGLKSTDTLAFEENVKILVGLKVSAENIGGPPTTHSNRCEFSVEFEPCTIEVQNHSAFPVTIIKAEIQGKESEKYGLAQETCTIGAKLKEEPPKPGGTCQSKVQLIAATHSVTNEYYVAVEAPNGWRAFAIVYLKI
jgi:hypothetical protein